MVAEFVPSIVKRAGDVLELFATHGLKLDAVHKTRLPVGEGLIGQVAATAGAACSRRSPQSSRIMPIARKPARRLFRA